MRSTSAVRSKPTAPGCHRSALEAETLEAIADRGYFNGAELLACHEDRITATVPRPDTSGNRKKDMFVKADFAYEAETDVYLCPAGKALTYRYAREEDGLMLRRYWQNDCQHCPLKSRCTTGKERRIARWEHEHLVEAMYVRMERDPDLMPDDAARSNILSARSRPGWARRTSRCGGCETSARRWRCMASLHQADDRTHRHRPAAACDPRLRIGNARSGGGTATTASLTPNDTAP